MNRIHYILTKLRLRLMARRVKTAKTKMLASIHTTKQATDRTNRDYRRFLSLSTKREQLAVTLRRLLSEESTKPLLKIKINTGRVSIVPNAKDALTVYDTEMALTRHRNGDWGELTESGWRHNNRNARTYSGKLLSRYRYHGEHFFLVETDFDRKRTVIRLEEQLQ